GVRRDRGDQAGGLIRRGGKSVGRWRWHGQDIHPPPTQEIPGGGARGGRSYGLRSCGARGGDPRALRRPGRCRRTAEAVKAESGGPVEEPGKELGSVQQEARTCPVCGTKFSAESEFCPVCILRGAAEGEAAPTRESGSVFGSADSPGDKEGTSQVVRFENYEVMLDE